MFTFLVILLFYFGLLFICLLFLHNMGNILFISKAITLSSTSVNFGLFGAPGFHRDSRADYSGIELSAFYSDLDLT